MRQYQNKLWLMLIIILCFAALFISVKITREVYENNKLLKVANIPSMLPTNKDYRTSLSDYTLYLNGEDTGLKALVSNKMVLLPMSKILSAVKIPFEFFQTDDVLEISFSAGRRFLMVQSDRLVAENTNEKNKRVEAFYYEGDVYANQTIFEEQIDPEMRIYHKEKAIFYNTSTQFHEVLPELSMLVKKNEKLMIQYMHEDQSLTIFDVAEDGSAYFSPYHDNLYWIDNQRWIDIKNQTIKQTSQPMYLTLDKKFFYTFSADKILTLYDEYLSVVFQTDKLQSLDEATFFLQSPIAEFIKKGPYTIILYDASDGAFNGAVFHEEEQVRFYDHIYPSPDGQSLLLMDESSLSLLQNGFQEIDLPVETIQTLTWISHQKVAIHGTDGNYIFNSNAFDLFPVPYDFTFLGNGGEGTYYKQDNILFYETLNSVEKLFNTQINAQKLIALEEPHDFILIPNFPNQSIYLYYDKRLRKLGNQINIESIKENLIESKLPEAKVTKVNTSEFKSVAKMLPETISISPEKESIAFLEEAGPFYKVRIHSLKELDQPMVKWLDITQEELLNIQMKWINESTLLIFTKKKVFILSLNFMDESYTKQLAMGVELLDFFHK